MRFILVLLIFIGIFLIIGIGSLLLMLELQDPSGDKCQVDADCVCTSTAPDLCGGIGTRWRCIENKCELGFNFEIDDLN